MISYFCMHEKSSISSNGVFNCFVRNSKKSTEFDLGNNTLSRYEDYVSILIFNQALHTAN